MNNKIVLVTGSSSGIGFGIAASYARQGANVILHGIEENPWPAEKLAKEHNAKTFYLHSDLAQKEITLEKLQKIQSDAGGTVDILINNAGIQYVSPIENFEFSQWQKIIDINLNSVFYLSKAVWTPMLEKKYGRIINISSVHGLRASEFKSAYVAAKHAVCGLTKVLALEGANKGITVNAICPGYVYTPLVEKQIRDQALAHKLSESEVIEKVLLKKQAIKKFISIDAISELCLYLSQPYADAITGSSIVLDGGWTSQ